MMTFKFSYYSGYSVIIILLHILRSTSENQAVTISTGDVVAVVGRQAELSCQLSPPQSAQYMEVHWFRGQDSRSVYQYRGGQEVDEEAAPEYMGRTEFLKEAIGEGKVSLRLHNISVPDDGLYHCSFNGSGFVSVASMNLSVTALGLETQIHVQLSSMFFGYTVECNSSGWFPQPLMEWKDSKGVVVPHSSISYSQDESRLFHMKMTLSLKTQSHNNMTCFIYNPVTGEEKQTTIVLTGDLSNTEHIWMLAFTSVIITVLTVIIVSLCWQCWKSKIICKNGGSTNKCRWNCIHYLNSAFAQLLCSLTFPVMATLYLVFRNRVSISDPLFLLYNQWMSEIAIMISVLTAFFILLVVCLYLRLRGSLQNVSDYRTSPYPASIFHLKYEIEGEIEEEM